MSLPPELQSATPTAPAEPIFDVRSNDVVIPLAPAVDELAETVLLPEDTVVPADRATADRMISGIDLIDYSVGGLLPRKVYLVKGESGLGKTITGLQFLTRGLEQGETGILITDQKPASVLAQARSIGFSLEGATKRNQLMILSPSDRYFELVESQADIQAIVEELADYIRQVDAKRLVIDPIYTLINTQYSAHFALMVAQSLLNALEDLPTTTLLVANDDANDPELNPILRSIEHNVFGVVELSGDSATGGRLMRLSKLRYASNENIAAHYRILNGRGLINYEADHERVDDITQPWPETSPLNRTVLLIGAGPETIRRVTSSLGDDYTVRAESDLQIGIRRARSEKPGLVFVTPAPSIAAATAILELAEASSSSIAFLSPATNRKSDRILYLRAGADDFITEPFSPDELRARVDALIRRSGRRLTTRDSAVRRVTTEDLASLLDAGENADEAQPVIVNIEDEVEVAPDFQERLERNVAAVSQLDTPFALYWIKAYDEDGDLNGALARLCREGDIVCHNHSGEFVAILTGTDADGVRGFENRIDERLAERVGPDRVLRGYRLYEPGQLSA